MREVLEGALAPEVATAAMFAALQRHGRVPDSSASVLELCRGPLSEVLDSKVGSALRDQVIKRLEQVLVDGDMTGTDVPLDVDVEFEGEPSITMTMPIVWREPVSVVIVASEPTFAARLEASLGAARVHAVWVRDEATLRRAMFSESPLLLLVDATAPPELDEASLAVTLRSLPDSVLTVVWGNDAVYGERLLPALDSTGVEAVDLSRMEGIGPLLDLILSRYQDEDA